MTKIDADKRIAKDRLYQLQPVFRQSLLALGQAAADAGLEPALLELVKQRASQMNGCAFCLHMHGADARRAGERPERLDVLAAWRETHCFTPREQAALLWTEALTAIADDHVPDAVYAEVRRAFSEAELAALTAAVIAINGWNRIAIAFRFVPAIAAP